MAYKVIYKKRFSNKLIKLLEYLEKEWSHQVAMNFLNNLEKRLDMIIKQPFVGKAYPGFNELGLFSKNPNLLQHQFNPFFCYL